MKNKKNLLVLALLIICLILVLVFYTKNLFVSSNAVVTTEAENVETDNTPSNKQLTQEKEYNNFDEKREIFRKLSKKLQKTLILSDASVFPIKFYGKVIDQYDKPISDVEILYYAGGGYLGGGSGFRRVTTDKNGIFEVKDVKGGSLNLREIKKDGYEIVIRPQSNLFHSFKEYPDSLVWDDYTVKKPYIYKAWKYSDKFDRKDLKKGDVDVYCKSGGDECTANLFGGPTQNSKKNYNKSQFMIQFFKDDGADRRNPGKWKLVITALGGGVLKAEGQYTSEAPKEGYLDSITYSNDDFVDGHNSGRINSFYIALKENIYARFSFRIEPYLQDNYCSISARYTINTAGESYLDSFNGW